MISLKTWLETVNYRVTEGSDYGWQCYGHDSYCLTSWDGNHDGSSFTITFDTRTQEVYCVEAHDFKLRRAYRMIHPDYTEAFHEECQNLGVSDKAWDDVNYTDLDVEEDWLEKARAIYAGKNYDARVQVPVDLEDGLLFDLMKQAHEQDVTLNTLIENILKETLVEHTWKK